MSVPDYGCKDGETGPCCRAGETGGWHDSKVALVSAAVFAPAAVAMLLNAHLSKGAQERHWHGCLPVFAAGICLEYAPFSHFEPCSHIMA